MAHQISRYLTALALKALPFFISLQAFYNQAIAADIEIVNSPNCQIMISGPIIQGDTESLRVASEILRYEGVWHGDELGPTRNRRVCLDSPGGSLVEAARLGEHLFQHGIGTVLEADAECLSACAWVFMLGFERGEELYYYRPNRRMHYTAKLGFHAPFLPIERTSILTGEKALQTQEALNAAVAKILELSNLRLSGQRPSIDADLVQRAFAAGNKINSFFVIENVDQAGRWQIPVFGVAWPARIGIKEAFWACTNLTQWPVTTVQTVDIGLARSSITSNLQASDIFANGKARVFGKDNGMQINKCVVDLRLKDGYLWICGANHVNGVKLGDVFGGKCVVSDDGGMPTLYRYNPLAVFPPETPLSELGEASRAIARRAGSSQIDQANDFQIGAIDPGRAALANAWLSDALATGRPVGADDHLHQACVPISEALHIVRVFEFATLRERPSFDAPVLARIPRGTPVAVQGQATLADVSEGRRECYEACQAAGADRSRYSRTLQRCYLENILWFPVRYNGQKGFVAGRYLGEERVD